VEAGDHVGCGDWHFYGDDKYNFYQHHDDHHDRAVSGSYSCEFVSRSLSLA
jgi:hypothetical protein